MPHPDDTFRIDSHKLMFHPRRVADWYDGKDIYPVYLEISPSGACNHRCTFCAQDYLGYENRFLDTAILKEHLTEIGILGLRSVLYGGEGEPLLHRDIADIISHTKGAGIDVAVTSNGVPLTAPLFQEIGPHLSWLKISINAGTASTYAAIHRTRNKDFDQVISNLERAAIIARQERFNCTIGAQMLLLPENAGEVAALAEIVRDIGLSYLVVKPYSQHPKSLTHTYEKLDYNLYLSLADQLKQYNDDRFSVVFRTQTMMKLDERGRGYQRCLALPFWCYIDAAGNVWGCSSFIGDERFRYGNIMEQSFADMWRGSAYRAAQEHAGKCLDPRACRVNCRMDEINRYLWELTHPSPHVNFI